MPLAAAESAVGGSHDWIGGLASAELRFVLHWPGRYWELAVIQRLFSGRQWHTKKATILT